MIAVEGFYYPLFRDLPDKTYTDKERLQGALEVTLGTSNKGFFGERKKVVGANLLTTKEEIERDYIESGKKQIDEYYIQIDEYHKGLNKEQKQKLIEEQKQLAEESIQQEKKTQMFEEILKREHEEYERREHEQEEQERELEEAAVKDAIDKPLKPIKTDLSD
jgi:hypothetical protein